MLLALGLPPGGTTCYYTYGTHAPRPITSTTWSRDPGGPISALANSGPP